MKRLICASMLLAVLAGCSTTSKVAQPLPSPTPAVTKDQTVAAQGRVESPLTIDLPSWYIKAPAPTEDFIFVAGTGVSNDLSMSHQKALMDAQLKLADKINGEMNALVKQQKNDSAGTVNTDKTSITTKKVIARTSLTGYYIEDSRIQPENRGYRTFVLVRYPLGDANRMLKDKLMRENQDNNSNASQEELDREINRGKPVSQVAPVTVAPVASGGTINLLPVDNAEYKARRDAALQKPGATVGQVTVQ